jgi:hypothetical protein
VADNGAAAGEQSSACQGANPYYLINLFPIPTCRPRHNFPESDLNPRFIETDRSHDCATTSGFKQYHNSVLGLCMGH